MGVFEQFPYTNYHDLNLDWLLNEMKRLRRDYEAFKSEMENAFEDFKTRVNQALNDFRDDQEAFKAEMRAAWNDFIITINNKIAEQDRKIAAVESAWAAFRTEINNTLSGWENRIAAVESAWAAFRTEINNTLSGWENRIAAVESAWSAFRTEINNTLSGWENRIAAVESAWAAFESELRGMFSDLSADIDAKCAACLADIEAFKNQISGDIASLQTGLNQINALIPATASTSNMLATMADIQGGGGDAQSVDAGRCFYVTDPHTDSDFYELDSLKMIEQLHCNLRVFVSRNLLKNGNVITGTLIYMQQGGNIGNSQGNGLAYRIDQLKTGYIMQTCKAASSEIIANYSQNNAQNILDISNLNSRLKIGAHKIYNDILKRDGDNMAFYVFGSIDTDQYLDLTVGMKEYYAIVNFTILDMN